MIGTTLKGLLQERDINVNELARQTGISAQTLYSIIKRDNMKVNFDVLLKLCEVLDVPVETFYETKGFVSPEKQIRDAREWDLVRDYRQLDDHGRKLVELVVEAERTRVEQS